MGIRESFHALGSSLIKPFVTFRNEWQEGMKEEKRASERRVGMHIAEWITTIYIDDAINASILPTLRQIGREYPTLSESITDQLALSTEERIDSERDRFIEEATQKLVGTIKDPQLRTEIHTRALRTAQQYWRKKLEEPVVNMDRFIYGRKRLVQIAEKLEQLEGNTDP